MEPYQMDILLKNWKPSDSSNKLRTHESVANIAEGNSTMRPLLGTFHSVQRKRWKTKLEMEDEYGQKLTEI